MRDVLSYTAFGVGLIAWAAFFWRAYGRGRDPSPGGLAVDLERKRQLWWIASFAVAMLMLAALL